MWKKFLKYKPNKEVPALSILEWWLYKFEASHPPPHCVNDEGIWFQDNRKNIFYVAAGTRCSFDVIWYIVIIDGYRAVTQEGPITSI